MDERSPQFHDLSMLETYTKMIDGCFENTRDQLETLHEVKDKPHILNRETIERITALYQSQLEDNWVLEEQLKRWLSLDLATEQKLEIERLQKQVKEIESKSKAVLELVTTHFSGNSIEDILEMDDGELGLQFLLGFRKP